MSDDRQILSRRRAPRRSLSRQVGLLIRGNYHISWCTEVGEGGMMVFSDVELKKKDRVVVTFNIPGVIHVIMRATVRYVVPPNKDFDRTQYGLYFEQVDFNTRRKIRNYVASAGKGDTKPTRKWRKPA